MILQIEVPEGNPPLAWYLCKHILQGAALGCRPFFSGPRPLPALHDTKIRYGFDPHYGTGLERIRLPHTVAREGWGDCNDLSLYEVSRRLAQGGYAMENFPAPFASISVADYLRNGGMHAQIRRADGEIEDPSVAYGAPVDWPSYFLYDTGRKKGP
jgi:hypothetical protein